MMVRVVIADDMGLALVGAEMLLNQEPDFEVVGTFQSFTELLKSLAHLPADVVLIGDRIEPGMDVLALVDGIGQVVPHSYIIVMSLVCDGLIVHELLTSGITGYLYKSDPLHHYLTQAVRAVMRARPFLSPTANAAYLTAMQSGHKAWPLDAEARDVLRRIAQGHRPQEIALVRDTPVRRIYWVCTKLRRRFGAETNEHLIARAAEEGFLP
jgi:DNA-binding NarL/FixJ family response regulator